MSLYYANIFRRPSRDSLCTRTHRAGAQGFSVLVRAEPVFCLTTEKKAVHYRTVMKPGADSGRVGVNRHVLPELHQTVAVSRHPTEPVQPAYPENLRR